MSHAYCYILFRVNSSGMQGKRTITLVNHYLTLLLLEKKKKSEKKFNVTNS